MDLSIIIVNWNTRELLLRCLDSVFSNIQGLAYEVWVVDNGSKDGSAEAVGRQFPEVNLVKNKTNLGFARANNQVLRKTGARYALLLNSDTILQRGAIEALIAFMDENPEVGIAAPQYLNQDGTRQNSFDNFPTLTTELLNKSILKVLFPRRYPSKREDYAAPLEVESVIGACMAVRHTAMEQVGYLDEDYFLFLEESDWCYRMKQAGFKVVHVPQAAIVHVQGASKNQRPGEAWVEYYRSSYLFFKKHRTLVSWVTLRILRPMKLIINLALTGLVVGFTLGRRPRVRRKFSIYLYLLLWHVQGCPQTMGLQGV